MRPKFLGLTSMRMVSPAPGAGTGGPTPQTDLVPGLSSHLLDHSSLPHVGGLHGQVVTHPSWSRR